MKWLYFFCFMADEYSFIVNYIIRAYPAQGDQRYKSENQEYYKQIRQKSGDWPKMLLFRAILESLCLFFFSLPSNSFPGSVFVYFLFWSYHLEQIRHISFIVKGYTLSVWRLSYPSSFYFKQATSKSELSRWPSWSH